jgi:hypothetical protein
MCVLYLSLFLLCGTNNKGTTPAYHSREYICYRIIGILVENLFFNKVSHFFENTIFGNAVLFNTEEFVSYNIPDTEACYANKEIDLRTKLYELSLMNKLCGMN